MSRKIESWKLPDGNFISSFIGDYAKLSDREIVILGIAVLDVCLVHLLKQRLADLPKTLDEFLGLTGSSAPASSFAARAQLAALCGVISPKDLKHLSALNKIRNQFAHKVQVDFTSQEVVKYLKQLEPFWEEHVHPLAKNHPVVRKSFENTWLKIGEKEAGRFVYSYVFNVLELHFGRIDQLNERVKSLKFYHPS